MRSFEANEGCLLERTGLLYSCPRGLVSLAMALYHGLLFGLVECFHASIDRWLTLQWCNATTAASVAVFVVLMMHLITSDPKRLLLSWKKDLHDCIHIVVLSSKQNMNWIFGIFWFYSVFSWFCVIHFFILYLLIVISFSPPVRFLTSECRWNGLSYAETSLRNYAPVHCVLL